jgi:hypothetical protein
LSSRKESSSNKTSSFTGAAVSASSSKTSTVSKTSSSAGLSYSTASSKEAAAEFTDAVTSSIVLDILKESGSYFLSQAAFSWIMYGSSRKIATETYKIDTSSVSVYNFGSESSYSVRVATSESSLIRYSTKETKWK